MGFVMVSDSTKYHHFTVLGGQENIFSQDKIFGEPPMVSNLLKTSKDDLLFLKKKKI